MTIQYHPDHAIAPTDLQGEVLLQRTMPHTLRLPSHAGRPARSLLRQHFLVRLGASLHASEQFTVRLGRIRPTDRHGRRRSAQHYLTHCNVPRGIPEIVDHVIWVPSG